MKRFSVQNHYLLELEQDLSYGDMKKAHIWLWEVFIAVNEDEYLGKAVCESKGVKLDWAPIKGMNLSEDILERCQRYMESQKHL